MTALAGLGAAAAALPASEAGAAGFALKEQSAAAQGNSYAGATAGAEDISYMFFNPAGLTLHDGNQIIVVASYILPTNETDNATLVTVAPLPNGESSENGGESAFVPALYAMWSATPDLKLGLGVNAPFGLKTKYSQTWAGRYHAVESDMKTLNINPVVAYRINNTLSVAAGLQAEKIDVTLSNMVPTVADGDALFEVIGDDWAYGFTLGAMFELSPKTRIGVGYRSEMAHELKGAASFGNNLFSQSTSGGADVTLPRMAQVGYYHDVGDTLAIMAELGWMGWSSLDQLVVNLDSDLGFGTTVSQNYDWDDVWFLGLGATWKASEQWSIRAGVAYDQSPIPNATRTPRVPDSDRTWVSLGVSFDINPSFGIDAGYTHIFMDDATVDIADAVLTGELPGMTATFENSVDILTVQAVIRF
jgi:long-chain fatty acid transport protein